MQTTLRISGMRSVHCARAVYTAMAAIPGVASATVVIGEAILEHASDLERTALEEAIAGVGYRLESLETRRRVMPLAPE